MKISPNRFGKAVMGIVSVGGLIISELALDTGHKSFGDLFWPPTARWIVWAVVGIIAGNLARTCAVNRKS